MPNAPSRSGRRLDMPLDRAVGYASHVLIKCSPPVFAGSKPCHRRVIWATADLYAKMPACKTVGQFQERLRCSRCGRRGWVRIEAARR